MTLCNEIGIVTFAKLLADNLKLAKMIFVDDFDQRIHVTSFFSTSYYITSD